MATLSAVFRLFDGYSSTVRKIIEGTEKASAKILGASKNTDIYNDALKKTGVSAGIANSGLTRLIGTVASLAALKHGVDLTDIYTNTNARLAMVTNGLEEQKSLQADIFAAADRTRGSYVEMANAASKLKMLAGDTFGSNQEAIGFAELLTKSLKVSGAGQAEQSSAFLQLTQAMTSGKLQGDEFRSVMENAPMVADAIAKYMGKTKAELKELSSKGVITADIIKNAMFQATIDINKQFDKMPMTFADVWQKIKNAGMYAFGEVFEKANAMLNSDMGQAAIQNLTGLIYISAGAFSALLDGIGWVADKMDVLGPVILGVAAAWGIYNIVLGAYKGYLLGVMAVQTVHKALLAAHAASLMLESGATFTATVAQYGFNAALMACPITWIIGSIIALIALFYAGVAAVNHFSGTSVSATGLIGGAFGVLAAYMYNGFIFPIWNAFAMFANFLGNVFHSPTAAVKVLFLDMANTCINYVLNMAKAIEAIVNKIPGVKVDITSGLENFKSGLEAKISTIKDESGWKEYVKQPELMDYTAAASKGYQFGSGIADKALSLFSGFSPDFGSSGAGGFGTGSSFATAGNPATVKGTGKGGAVKVENEEDIQWMRKLAERDYVARIAQNTLAPNIRVEFTGPITKEADVDGVASHMAEQLKEIIATAPEGVYA